MFHRLVVITQHAVQFPVSINEQPSVDEFGDRRLSGFLPVFGIEEFVVAHLDGAIQYRVVV